MRKKRIDMCNGPLFGKIFLYSVPVILSGILQLLFNAADVIVVGRFAGKTALAAVGSTGSLINLIVNLFMGLSIGVSVAVAQNIGAQKHRDVHETVQTSVLLSLICGVIVTAIGLFLARPLLELMGSPDDVIDQAVLYVRIYFIGITSSLVYNFGAAILRANGDTKRPLYFLSVAGIVNVVLNLVFVIRFKMGVAGVGIATVISQTISAALVLICLSKLENSCRVDLRHLKLYKDKLISIVKIGFPAGLQSSIFSISNVLIQSSINSFGSIAMAGNAAASNIDGFIYTSMNSIYQSSLAFTGQNVGAKRFDRINRICGTSCFIVAAVGMLIGGIVYIFGEQLLGIYSTDPEIIEYGMIRLSVLGKTYFLCGIMDVLCGLMRGMGESLLPMVVSTIGACGLRIVWIYTYFASHRTLFVLYLSYPITWFITAAAHIVCYFIVKKRLLRTNETKAEL